MDNKKYYYMRLKEDFFDSEEMKLLESLPDGYLYSNILLKLYLLSLKRNGCLMFNNRIPYNAQMLSTLTRHQIGTVEKALGVLKEFGFIEVLDTGAMYMLDIQSLVGKSSTEADRKREYRAVIAAAKGAISAPTEDNGTNVQTNGGENSDKQAPENRDKRLEIRDKRLEDIEETPAAPPPPPPTPKAEKPKKHKYGEYQNVLLTDEELENLKSEYSDWASRIEKLSNYIASTGKSYKSHYATIKNWARRDAETGYKRQKTQAPAQTFTVGSAEKMAIERLRREREEKKKTAGNDQEVRARAEELKRQLGG